MGNWFFIDLYFRFFWFLRLNFCVFVYYTAIDFLFSDLLQLSNVLVRFMLIKSMLNCPTTLSTWYDYIREIASFRVTVIHLSLTLNIRCCKRGKWVLSGPFKKTEWRDRRKLALITFFLTHLRFEIKNIYESKISINR